MILFNASHLTNYLLHLGINVELLTITETASGIYSVQTSDLIIMDEVLEQVDRDESHPITMDTIKVNSKVVSKTEGKTVLEIQEVSRQGEIR